MSAARDLAIARAVFTWACSNFPEEPRDDEFRAIIAQVDASLGGEAAKAPDHQAEVASRKVGLDSEPSAEPPSTLHDASLRVHPSAVAEAVRAEQQRAAGIMRALLDKVRWVDSDSQAKRALEAARQYIEGEK